MSTSKGASSRKRAQPLRKRMAVYAVLRDDAFLGGSALARRVTVKEIVPTLEEAKAEVERLNALQRAGDEIRYWWQTTRFVLKGPGK